MKYRITVETIEDPTPDDKYPAYREVFQQLVNDLDVHDLAVYVNEPLRYREAEEPNIIDKLA